MFEWDFSPPRSAPMGDHDVRRVSDHLAGRRVALLVCGGIAAMKAPMVARALRSRGAEVTAFCSDEALRYVGREALEWSTCNPLVTQLTWRAEHLSDSAPFDAYLVAPATYNTLGKAAAGIADGVVTATLASAFGRMRAGRTVVLFAPTMHGSMHHPVLEQSCRALASLGARFVSPRDDYGKHNLPDEGVLVAAVCRALSPSPLRGRSVLVATAKVLDAGADAADRLGAELHEALVLRGADSTLLLGPTSVRPAPWLPSVSAGDAASWLSAARARLGARPALDAAVVGACAPELVEALAGLRALHVVSETRPNGHAAAVIDDLEARFSAPSDPP